MKDESKQPLTYIRKADVMTEFELFEEKEINAKRNDKYLSDEAKAIIKKRKLQAKALWEMYRRGELIKQTIQIGEAVRQDFLYSHHSIHAV